MDGIYALRHMAGHSDATKPGEQRADERDATAAVFLSGTMLLFLAATYQAWLDQRT